jgi:predicted N-formylglutamate amidohydrolase
MKRERGAGLSLVLTCEHAGSRIPRRHARRFRGAARALASHRGWDPGALVAARALARRLRVPLLAVTWSRLFVEANRSIGNPGLWSRYTMELSAEEKERILERYWWPHRRQVEEAVRRAAARGSVLHVAVHSFTPVLDGRVRNADVGLLYDSRRPSEVRACRRWQTALHAIDPALRVRRNYPYNGAADGLTTWLRRRFPDARYAGVELELNQGVLASASRARLTEAVAKGLAELLGR